MTRVFSPTPEEMNQICLQEGRRIYFELKDKFEGKNIDGLDKMLNSLCSALVILVHQNVGADDFECFLQLIHKILHNNLKEMKSTAKFK